MLKTAQPFYVTVGCHSALPTAGGQASQGVWGHAASLPPTPPPGKFDKNCAIWCILKCFKQQMAQCIVQELRCSLVQSITFSAGEKLLPTVDIMSTVEETHGGHFDSTVDIFQFIALSNQNLSIMLSNAYIQEKNIKDKSDNYSDYNAPIWIIFTPKCREIHDAGHYDRRQAV